MNAIHRLKEWAFPDKRARTPGVDVSHQTILYLENITVSFDGFRALNDLTLYITVGELRCTKHIGMDAIGSRSYFSSTERMQTQ